MRAYKPIAVDHAVEQAIVGVRWRHKPTDEQFSAAVESASNIAEQFGLPGKLQLDPLSLLMSRQHISVGFDGLPEALPGFVFQQVYPDGTMAQEMTLERGAVTFRTRNYRRWSDIQEIIQGAIGPITELLCEGDSNRVSVIEFRCIDRFVSDTDHVPSLSELIRDDTKLVPDHLKTLANYLHCHLGWFEEISDKERILYNLNVTVQTDDRSGKPSASILQVISRQLGAGAEMKEGLADLLVSTFDELHARDKGLLFELLDEGLSEAINLKGESEAVAL